MKEELYYKNMQTDEILKCHTFTSSCCIFERANGALIERDKSKRYKRVTSKKAIAVFEGTLKKPTTINMSDYSWGYILRLMQATGYTDFNKYFEEEIMQLVMGCLDPDSDDDESYKYVSARII